MLNFSMRRSDQFRRMVLSGSETVFTRGCRLDMPCRNASVTGVVSLVGSSVRVSPRPCSTVLLTYLGLIKLNRMCASSADTFLSRSGIVAAAILLRIDLVANERARGPKRFRCNCVRATFRDFGNRIRHEEHKKFISFKECTSTISVETLFPLTD